MFGSFVFTHNEHCIGRFDPEGPIHFLLDEERWPSA
jgi:hypothetical protein